MIAKSRSVIATFLMLATFALPVWAGSYLDRAALLLAESNRAGHMLRTRLSDKEFTRMVHAISRARLDAAAHMLVPKEVSVAHPHLLMVLENCERAADAAVHSEHQSFLIHLQKATEEERILRSILDQHGWSLPNL